MGRILVADDEPGFQSFVVEVLEDEGHEVHAVGDGVAALAQARSERYHLLVTDIGMPGLDGLQLVERLAEEQPELEVVMLTAHGSVDAAVRAMKLGAFDFLTKPLESPAELRLTVERALERHRYRTAQEVERDLGAPSLSFGDPAMEEVSRLLRKVAGTDATVLLLGESGTGKEVAARTVHATSSRRDGPFVAINCAALSPALLESELFGHEKGAFTGADERRRGRIELAEGGTFFLDEIGELGPELQAKLLRVLQEKRFERVGGRQTIVADVRWVAATHRPLNDMVAQGSFREDLFHRIAVFPVRLPPLRERRSEIPPLAEVLLARIGAELGRPGLRLDAEALDWLKRQDWPGNVRALANGLERAAILAEAQRIGVADLERLGTGLELGGQTEPRAVESDEGPVDLSLEAAERRAIARAMAAAGGQRKTAASLLGIGVRTLYDKIKRYGLG